MSNDYFNASGNPVAQSRGASSVQRAEFNSVEDGFDKVPPTASLWADKANYGVDTGAADAYIVTIASTYNVAYTDGMTLKVKALNANTGASTINVNGLGIKTIVRPDGTALQANDIVSGQVFQITYNSTSGKFQMANAYGGPAGPTGTLAGNATAGINWLQGPNIASATTMDIWTGSQGNEMIVTGTTATTGFSAAPQAGASRVLIANGAWPLTHGANLLLPGSANYTCAAGDIVVVHAITTTQFRCEITRSNGVPVVSAGLTLLDIKTASASSSLDFTQYIDSTYDQYLFEIVNLLPSAGAIARVRTTSNGGSSWDSGVADYAYSIAEFYSGGPNVQGLTAAQIALNAATISSTTANGGMSGTVRLYSPSNTTMYKHVIWDVNEGGASFTRSSGAGARNSTSAVNGVQFIPDTGTWTSGTIRMYGVRKS